MNVLKSLTLALVLISLPLLTACGGEDGPVPASADDVQRVESTLGFDIPDDIEDLIIVDTPAIYSADFKVNQTIEETKTALTEALKTANMAVTREWMETPQFKGGNYLYDKDGQTLNVGVRQHNGRTGVSLQLDRK